MIKYFVDTDNFNQIITDHFTLATTTTQIQTGWTNYVFRVEVGDKNYIFRFPRNEFFANALIKEYNFTNFIKPYISFKTPNFTLNYYNGKPYTIHEEITGESLSEVYLTLTDFEKANLAMDCCKLLKELSLVKVTCDNFQSVSNFLDNLANVSQSNYNLKNHNFLKKLEQGELVISHGDFNPGNLILKDNKLIGVIDFSFAGISSPLTDLSRLIGRTPAEFKSYLIHAYKLVFNKKINMLSIKKLNKMWQYVEKKYICYIEQNHPQIVLPTLK